MAYGITPNAFDEYLQMSEHTARDALFFFNMCIMELYMPKYLSKPTLEDVVKNTTKAIPMSRYFRECLEYDCMHWNGKMSHVMARSKLGDKEYPTIMLEAEARKICGFGMAFLWMTGGE
ncbi:probable serine/threonine-protein kinase PBL7 [Tanacetum coccineum]